MSLMFLFLMQDVVADELYKTQSCLMKDALIGELEEDCPVPTSGNMHPINDLVRAEKEHLEAAEAEHSKEEVEI